MVAFIMTGCSQEPGKPSSAIKVEVVSTADGYRLLRGGLPYAVRGAGMARGDIGGFAANGGNSIRNWTTDDAVQDVRALLDAAQANGVTVALSRPMRSERSGFDYDDPVAVADQLESFRRAILRHRDHPALLLWIVGNELNHSYSNPRVFDAVNDVARMIHELDPNHPVTTAMEGFMPAAVAEALERAPELDFLSFQLYGDLFSLPERIRAAGFSGAFMVTEWGTVGWWETEKTPWGAPVELTSSEKADVILRAQQDALKPLARQLLGSYVFKWGQKQERTPTWFGLLLESGEETESVDVMHYVWTGDWPANRAPRVESLRLDGGTARDGVTLAPGGTYGIRFDVRDPDGDPLRFRLRVKPESGATTVGGDPEQTPPDIDGWVTDPEAAVTTITARVPGKYRLFAYAYDDHGHAAHANIPFLVQEAGSGR